MTTRDTVTKKLCPQCGYDVAGTPQPPPDAAITKRIPPPEKLDYDCGNCGFQWTD